LFSNVVAIWEPLNVSVSDSLLRVDTLAICRVSAGSMPCTKLAEPSSHCGHSRVLGDLSFAMTVPEPFFRPGRLRMTCLVHGILASEQR